MNKLKGIALTLATTALVACGRVRNSQILVRLLCVQQKRRIYLLTLKKYHLKGLCSDIMMILTMV